MKLKTRNERIKKLFDECYALANDKGKAYSGEDDCLSNFKRNAEKLNLSKYQVWAIYAEKHLDTIINSIKFNPDKPVDETEGLRGRIIDAINYLAILESLLAEDENDNKPKYSNRRPRHLGKRKTESGNIIGFHIDSE